MFSKKKRKEKFLRKWTSFFHRKRMFIVDQSTGLGRYNTQPSPSLPPPNNQALVENCTTRCIIKPAHICKEYCKHRYVCFQTLQLGKACFLTAKMGGSSEDTEGRVRNSNKAFPPLGLS